MNFIVFDTEDNSPELMKSGKSGFDKTVTQIAALSDDDTPREYYSRGDVSGFIKWLLKQPEKFIYAHNLQYDLGNIFGDNLDSFDMVMVGGRLIRASWRGKVFVDSFNVWPMSAKKIGKAFGLVKLEMDIHSREYVFRDVEIIRKAMLFAWQFVGIMGLPSLPPTLGGLSVKVWKAMGGQNCHDSSVLSRQALFGGRVELFKQHNDTPIQCYTDINSLYPFVMAVNEYPDMLEPQSELTKFGIADVTVRQPETDLTVLPVRSEEGMIIYPYGKFRGTWTIAEIRYAETCGLKIERVHEVMGTNSSMNPYSEFVERIYKQRLAANSEAEKLFFKLLMNNLYGRLSVSGKISRSVNQTKDNCNSGVPYGKKVLCEYLMPLSDEVNWSHGAHVTAYGRIELHKYMRKIGASNMIYCDTDSTIFDCPSRHIPFPTGKEIGAMKNEGWQVGGCETYAPKCYRLGENYKAKGVPVRLAEQFVKTGEVHFDLPFKLRESVRFFDNGNSKKLSVWRNVSRTRKSEYLRKELKNNRYFPCHFTNV
jgi:hypothetical protein